MAITRPLHALLVRFIVNFDARGMLKIAIARVALMCFDQGGLDVILKGIKAVNGNMRIEKY
ncbi:TPA: hypothetical protein PXO92_003909 [Yersinia enterocolitica]|nr:hypothetical protein [Yersinia enterocolitica]